MTMKFTQLVTYFDASEADTTITFLDGLRDLLWATYGEEIIEMRQATLENTPSDGEPLGSEFDDEINF